MARRRALVVLLCACLFPAAGCSPEAAGTGAFTKVVYEVTGGVAGFDRHLAIAADGAFTLRARDGNRPDRSGNLTGREVRTLREAASQADWPASAGAYVDPSMADALIETIRIEVSGQEYQVVVGTGANPPPHVRPMLDQLRRVLAQHLTR